MTEVGVISDLNSGSAGTCSVVLTEGHTLKIQSSVVFPLAALVKAEIGNRMWMGEVHACEAAHDGFLIEIQIESFLQDVANVEELAARFRHERGIHSKSGSKPGSASVPLVSTRRDIS